MSDRLRHLAGHLRRHGIAYAALAVAFSFSPVPSMAADLVTTGEIANGAVTQPKLAADSVVGGKILNESVTGADVKDGTVGAVDVRDGSIGTADVADGSIGALDVANQSLTHLDIADGGIVTNDIADASLRGQDIHEGTIEGYNVLDGSLTGGDVAEGSLNGGDIADGSIAGSDLNLFHDNQCTGETVQGTAFVDTKNVNQYGVLDTKGLSWVHSCSGQLVQVRRDATGVYTISFEGNPARLAVVSLASCCFATVKNYGPGLFVVRTLNHLGGEQALTDGFSILIY